MIGCKKTNPEDDERRLIYIRDALALPVPLPNGHGRLIDVDSFLKKYKSFVDDFSRNPAAFENIKPVMDGCSIVLEMLNEEPTIIEADKKSNRHSLSPEEIAVSIFGPMLSATEEERRYTKEWLENHSVIVGEDKESIASRLWNDEHVNKEEIEELIDASKIVRKPSI